MVFSSPQFRRISDENSYIVNASPVNGSYENVRNYGVLSVVFYGNGPVNIAVYGSYSETGDNAIIKNFTLHPNKKLAIDIFSEYVKVDTEPYDGVSGKLICMFDRSSSNGSSGLPNENIPNGQEVGHVKSILYGKDNDNVCKVVGVTSNSINVHVMNPRNNIEFFSKQTTTNDSVGFDTLTVGSGACNYTAGFPHTRMSVHTGNDKVVRQQHGYTTLVPGVCMSFFLSGTIHSGVVSDHAISRIGCFDDLEDKLYEDTVTGDGYFFQHRNDTMYVVVRTSYVDNVQVDTAIPQMEWNINTLDDVDFSKRVVFVIVIHPDHTIMFGVKYGNQTHYCHTHVPDDVYSCRMSLPIRYELSGLSGLEQVCDLIQYDAYCVSDKRIHEYQLPTYSFGMTNAIEVNDEECIIGFKLNDMVNYPRRPRVTLRIIKLNLMCTTGGNIVYTVYKFKSPGFYGNDVITPSKSSKKNPSSLTWDNGNNNKALQGSAACLTTSPAKVKGDLQNGDSGIDDLLNSTASVYPYTILDRGYFSNNTDQIITDSRFEIKSDIHGNSDLIVVTCFTIGSKESVLCSLQWVELE